MDDADSLSGLLADWHIAEDSYTVAPYELGRGQFGVVKGAEWNGTPVAMKILFNSDKEENANLFKKELALMQTVRSTTTKSLQLLHRVCMRCFGIVTFTTPIYLLSGTLE
jgi:serine/threonine protein kinase